MRSPNIETFREVVPYIYSWKTPDIPKYDGWEKIGYTEQDSSETRIAQQASQLNVEKVKVWSLPGRVQHRGRRALHAISTSTHSSSSRASSARRRRSTRSAPSGTTSPPPQARPSITS